MIGVKSNADQVPIAIIISISDESVHRFRVFVFAINSYINTFIVVKNFHSCPRRGVNTLTWNNLWTLLRPFSFMLPDIFIQPAISSELTPIQFGYGIYTFIGIFKRNNFLHLILSVA